MTVSGDQSQVNYTKSGTLQLPREEPMMLDRGHWRRIRRNVGRLGNPLADQAMTWAAAALGVLFAAASGGVALIASHASTGYWVAFFVTAAWAVPFMVCFFLVGRRERKRYGLSVQSVCEDMDDVGEKAGVPRPLEMPQAQNSPAGRVRAAWRALTDVPTDQTNANETRAAEGVQS